MPLDAQALLVFARCQVHADGLVCPVLPEDRPVLALADRLRERAGLDHVALEVFIAEGRGVALEHARRFSAGLDFEEWECKGLKCHVISRPRNTAYSGN